MCLLLLVHSYRGLFSYVAFIISLVISVYQIIFSGIERHHITQNKMFPVFCTKYSLSCMIVQRKSAERYKQILSIFLAEIVTQQHKQNLLPTCPLFSFFLPNSLPLFLVSFPSIAMPFVLRTPIYHGVKVERDIIMGCRAGERRQG